MNERKTFNHKDDEKLNQLHALLNDARNMIFGENRNFQLAKNKIQEFMNEASERVNKDDPNIYNFDNAIDFILYSKINKSKIKTVWCSIPFYVAYSFLAYIYNEEKNYDEALKILDKQIKIAPLNLDGYFERAETFKMQKKWEQFKEETQKIYPLIYDASDLARFYRNLGYYYIEQNHLDFAYALYTVSIYFEENNNAFQEMMYIDQKLGEKYKGKIMDPGKALKWLEQNHIPFGAPQENIDLLISIYANSPELMANQGIEQSLANKIYGLTKDDRFAPYYEVSDRISNCVVMIPRNWSELKPEVIKEKFNNPNEHPIFAGFTDTDAFLLVLRYEKCPPDGLDQAYQSKIESLRRENVKVLRESKLDSLIKSGLKRFNCVLLEANGMRFYYCFTLINQFLISFSINVSTEIDFNDLEKFNNQKNMTDLIHFLSMISES